MSGRGICSSVIDRLGLCRSWIQTNTQCNFHKPEKEALWSCALCSGSSALSEFLRSVLEVAVTLFRALCAYHCVTAFTGCSLQLPVSDECTNIVSHVSIILSVVIACCIIFYRHLDISVEKLKALNTNKKRERFHRDLLCLNFNVDYIVPFYIMRNIFSGWLGLSLHISVKLYYCMTWTNALWGYMLTKRQLYILSVWYIQTSVVFCSVFGGFYFWAAEHLKDKCVGQGHIAAGFLNEANVVWRSSVHTKCRHANDREQ